MEILSSLSCNHFYPFYYFMCFIVSRAFSMLFIWLFGFDSFRDGRKGKVACDDGVVDDDYVKNCGFDFVRFCVFFFTAVGMNGLLMNVCWNILRKICGENLHLMRNMAMKRMRESLVLRPRVLMVRYLFSTFFITRRNYKRFSLLWLRIETQYILVFLVFIAYYR